MGMAGKNGTPVIRNLLVCWLLVWWLLIGLLVLWLLILRLLVGLLDGSHILYRLCNVSRHTLRTEAYHELASAVGTFDEFLLNIKFVFDVKLYLTFWTNHSDSFHSVLFMLLLYKLPRDDRHVVVELAPHDGMLLVV